VATSWSPPVAECPVRASGTKPSNENPKRVAVHPQVNVRWQPTATISATQAVISHARGTERASTRTTNTSGSSTCCTGRPALSAALKNELARAKTTQSHAATPAVRTAPYPSAARTPDRCGGTRNADSSNDPKTTTADTSASSRTTVTP